MVFVFQKLARKPKEEIIDYSDEAWGGKAPDARARGRQSEFFSFAKQAKVDNPKIIRLDTETGKFVLNGVPRDELFKAQMLAMAEKYLQTPIGADELVTFYEKNVNKIYAEVGITGRFRFAPQEREAIKADAARIWIMGKEIYGGLKGTPGAYNTIAIDTVGAPQSRIVTHEYGHMLAKNSAFRSRKNNEAMTSLINNDSVYYDDTEEIKAGLREILDMERRRRSLDSMVRDYFGL